MKNKIKVNIIKGNWLLWAEKLDGLTIEKEVKQFNKFITNINLLEKFLNDNLFTPNMIAQLQPSIEKFNVELIEREMIYLDKFYYFN